MNINCKFFFCPLSQLPCLRRLSSLPSLLSAFTREVFRVLEVLRSSFCTHRQTDSNESSCWFAKWGQQSQIINVVSQLFACTHLQFRFGPKAVACDAILQGAMSSILMPYPCCHFPLTHKSVPIMTQIYGDNVHKSNCRTR